MSEKSSAVNFIIHDTNGKPQMVKVLQNSDNDSDVNPNSINVTNLPISKTDNIQTINLNHTLDFESKLVKIPISALEKIQNINCKIEPIETEEIEIEYIEDLTELDVIDILPKVGSDTDSSDSLVPLVHSEHKPKFVLKKMSHASRRRHDSDNDHLTTEYTTKRRKHADKVGKGLRHFSMKVCEKVRTKGFTSYNEVADELVMEFAAGMHGSGDSQQYDQKNIRRRVYDALNVLMAMNIISKEKKEIRWLGLPTNSVQECTTLEKEKQTKLEQIQKKTQQLQELILQHISFKSLIDRNKEAEDKGLKPSPSSAIHLPFIVVNTSDKALIDCSISNDKTEYMFNFNKRFQIYDDIDILKRMGLLFGLDKGECSEEDIERAKSMVPKTLEYYVEQMGRGVTTKMSCILDAEEDDDDSREEGLEEEGEGEEDDQQDAEQENNEYSDDSSDVDV